MFSLLIFIGIFLSTFLFYIITVKYFNFLSNFRIYFVSSTFNFDDIVFFKSPFFLDFVHFVFFSVNSRAQRDENTFQSLNYLFKYPHQCAFFANTIYSKRIDNDQAAKSYLWQCNKCGRMSFHCRANLYSTRGGTQSKITTQLFVSMVVINVDGFLEYWPKYFLINRKLQSLFCY